MKREDIISILIFKFPLLSYEVAFEKQDKVFPNYRENDMKNKSETDFSERRLKWAEK